MTFRTIPLCISVALLACLAGPWPPDPPQPVTPELSAHDYSGAPAAPHALPQRPVFHITHGLTGPPPAWALLSGGLDAPLIADLDRPPLNQTHQTRRVPVATRDSGRGTFLWPTRALDRGARYTLALPATDAAAIALGRPGPYARELAVGTLPSAGAALVHALPAHGQARVGPALPKVRLAFDGPISDCRDLSLHAEATPAASSVASAGERVPCGVVDDRGVHCCVLHLRARLAEGRSYRLDSSTVTDAHGAPLAAASLVFTTGLMGASIGSQPPALLPLPCAADEQPLTRHVCARPSDRDVTFRLRADEPVALAVETGGLRAQRIAPHGEGVVSLGPLRPARRYLVQLGVRGTADQTLTLRLQVNSAPDLIQLAISEVLADPLGPEPAQEYVELHNYGSAAVPLSGVRLADDPLGPELVLETDRVLAGGGRALLVADTYDPADPSGPQPRPGAPLVRVGAHLVQNGLRNLGEALVLRDRAGRRISQSPALASQPGACLRRKPSSCPRRGEPDDFEVGPCDPGR